MKKLASLLFASILLISCGEGEKKSDSKSDQKAETKSDSTANETSDEIAPADLDYKNWIISISGTEDKSQAIADVKKLREEHGDTLFGYLWIPDYKSLSGKEMFVVFRGPYYKDDCIKELVNFKKTVKGAYAVKADKESETRWAAYSAIDIRVDKKKQNLVLIYATPEDEENYTGEDWGFFVNDVSSYMQDHHDDIYFGTLYRSWFDEDMIKKIETEVEAEGFGYLCIKPNGEKLFISHDMPSGVISEMCEFFGYGCEEPLHPED